MATSLPIAVADAVAALLNDHSFSEPVAAVRRVLPCQEIRTLTAVTVSVVPRSRSIAPASRAMAQQTVAIDIGVQQKIGRDTDAEVARLLGLCDQIVARVSSAVPDGIAGLLWARTEHDPIYDPDHLAQDRVFTGAVTVTYRVLQPIG